MRDLILQLSKSSIYSTKPMDKVQSTLDALSADSKNGSKAFDNLSSSASSAGTSFSELAGYARSMDSSLKTLNSNVNAITRAMQEAGSSAGGAGAEFTRAEAILENLGNQLAILDEAQENGARSAAILAAQIRAGSKATDEEKQKIGELTGRLYDMKTGVDTEPKATATGKTPCSRPGIRFRILLCRFRVGSLRWWPLRSRALSWPVLLAPAVLYSVRYCYCSAGPVRL
nr:hypothetical protein [Klebsiella pneumoniae]